MSVYGGLSPAVPAMLRICASGADEKSEVRSQKSENGKGKFSDRAAVLISGF
jgi:hypothetical protein